MGEIINVTTNPYEQNKHTGPYHAIVPYSTLPYHNKAYHMGSVCPLSGFMRTHIPYHTIPYLSIHTILCGVPMTTVYVHNYIQYHTIPHNTISYRMAYKDILVFEHIYRNIYVYIYIYTLKIGFGRGGPT